MGHIAKGYFVQGFEFGLKEFSADKDYRSLTDWHYSKAIDGLDIFYKNHSNREIRIHVALYIVLHKIKGPSIEKITKLTELARKNPTKIPKIRK